MKKGALASVGAGFAATGVGTALAQDGGDDGDDLFVEDEALDGVMFEEAFVPGGRFVIVSPNIDVEQEMLPEDLGGFLSDYNMRIIRYIHPTTQNLPLFIQDDVVDVGDNGEQDAIPPYVPRVGLVVNDDFVEDDGVFFQGTDVNELDVGDLDQVRPSIFVNAPEFNPLDETERAVRINFSPVREDEEEAVFEENETEIFGGAEPFGEEEGPDLGDGTGTETA